MPRSLKKNKITLQERGLGRESAWGLSWEDQKLVEIDKRLKGKKRFSVILHELCHQCFPEASEAQILRAEKMMIDVLWEQGYRRVELK